MFKNKIKNIEEKTGKGKHKKYNGMRNCIPKCFDLKQALATK